MSSITIMYLCYGAQSIYDQTAYSILSLLRVAGENAGFRVTVYCERPEWFAPLPVETVAVNKATLDAWLGPSNYHHRRKTCAIIDAVGRYGGTLMFVDSDTYWMRRPEPLFAHIGPGRACFHILEGFLQSTGTPFDAALGKQLATHRYQLPSAETVSLTKWTPMWNTGVVGLHGDDLHLVHEALALSDAIWADADPAGAYGKKIHHAEQFAMGYVFRHHRLKEAAAWVYHYWPLAVKTAIEPALPDLIASGLLDRSPANLDAIYARRPREAGSEVVKDRAKMAIRRVALALGLPSRGVRRSIG